MIDAFGVGYAAAAAAAKEEEEEHMWRMRGSLAHIGYCVTSILEQDQ